MTWLKFLFHVSGALQLAANVIVMFYAFPAFKRTKQRAFLFIWAACLLGTFDTIFDHTVGLDRMEYVQYVAYHTLRRLAHFAAVALDAIGAVWLIQSYLRIFESKSLDVTPNGVSNPANSV